jgi:proteasome assembly chaperone (PAC2) family protein
MGAGSTCSLLTMDLFTLTPPPPMTDPVLLIGLAGWGDAAAAASDACDWLTEDAQPVVTFNPDAVFDYRSNRPILRANAGEMLSITWPRLEIVHLNPSGRDVLALVGSEPDYGWAGISDAVVDIAERFGVTNALTVGSVPAPVRHAIPTAVFGAASDSRLLLAGDELLMDDIVVPASAGTVFRAGLEQAGIPAIGYWAQVPQYVGRPYQPAMHALLTKISAQLDVEIDLTSIALEAEEQISRLDEILERRSDARDFVAGLELSVGTTSKVPADLPTADEIADEISEFLRSAQEDEDS